MLSLNPVLRAAAKDLGRLPEIIEATRLIRTSADYSSALRQVERAREVMAAVPMPALQLVAGGALAQLLRKSGKPLREAAVWQDALATCTTAEPTLRLHALHGAASLHLHQGDASAALSLCDDAAALVDGAAEWRATFGSHRALALILLGDNAADGVAVEQQARSEEAARAANAPRAVAEVMEAAAEGSSLLLGDARAKAGEDDAARKCWAAIVPEEDDGEAGWGKFGGYGFKQSPAAASARAMREVAARVRLGSSLLTSGDVKGSRAHLAGAVERCELSLPGEHPLLPYSLGQLAAAIAADGEFVAAEGLYRSAIGALEAAGGGILVGGGPSAVPPARVPLLLPALHSFAGLLERLDTNGKPRTAEAEQMRGKAAELRAAHAEALPADREWLGLEPWYAAATEVDWLGACLPETE